MRAFYQKTQKDYTIFMLVIIPNPNQTASLVHMQKNFIKDSSAQTLFYQASPLWIFLEDKEFSNRDFSKDELKEFSAAISKVELEHPRVYFSKNLQQMVLGSHSLISTDSRILQGELVLCRSLKDAKDIPNPKLFSPMELKIFRIANAVRLDEHSLAVTDFVWKKLKA